MLLWELSKPNFIDWLHVGMSLKVYVGLLAVETQTSSEPCAITFVNHRFTNTSDYLFKVTNHKDF